MPTLGSITKTVRISPADLEIIEDLMKDGTSWSGAIHKLCQNSGVPAEIKREVENPDLAEIISMATLCGCTLDSFYKQVREALEVGALLINNGKVEVGMPSWVERFVSACEDKCLDSERVGESAVKAIERGTI